MRRNGQHELSSSTTQERVIAQACLDIRNGALLEDFVVDVIQGGAGTSTNMNANEVIANRGLEIAGRHKGEYNYLHPVEHVNMSQSTNDVYPTALKLALHFGIYRLTEAMAELRAAFTKASEFSESENRPHPSAGRGAERSAGILHVRGKRRKRARMKEAALLIHEINLGATAIGTVSRTPRYAEVVGFSAVEVSGNRAPRRAESRGSARMRARRPGVVGSSASRQSLEDVQESAPGCLRGRRRTERDQFPPAAGRRSCRLK